MRVEKKINTYANKKMDKLKDDDFFNSVSSHFDENKKRHRLSQKTIVALASSVATVLVIVVGVVLFFEFYYQSEYAQYRTVDATITDLNNDCMLIQFSDDIANDVKLSISNDTDIKTFYTVNYTISESSSVKIVCIVDVNYGCNTDTKSYSAKIGDFDINYNIYNEYSNGQYNISVYANLFTENERLIIEYKELSQNEENGFLQEIEKIIKEKA